MAGPAHEGARTDLLRKRPAAPGAPAPDGTGVVHIHGGADRPAHRCRERLQRAAHSGGRAARGRLRRRGTALPLPLLRAARSRVLGRRSDPGEVMTEAEWLTGNHVYALMWHVHE